MNKKELNYMLEIYRENRYQVNSERNMDVCGHNVHEMTKQGRKMLLCGCFNHTYYSSGDSLCTHKLFYINFPLIKLIMEKIKIMKQTYEIDKKKSQDEEIEKLNDSVIQDFEELEKIKF